MTEEQYDRERFAATVEAARIAVTHGQAGHLVVLRAAAALPRHLPRAEALRQMAGCLLEVVDALDPPPAELDDGDDDDLPY